MGLKIIYRHRTNPSHRRRCSHLLTRPLITKADGGKFGKTESEISTDRNQNSLPINLYQFIFQR